MARSALVVVDFQRDFCDGGALAVPEASKLAPALSEAVNAAHQAGWLIVFTRDWHPPEHDSFQAQGGPWPPHCVAGSPGAQFHPDVRVPDSAEIISKGEAAHGMGYSPFETPGLDSLLRNANVSSLAVAGVALEYCVRATCMDARARGYDVTVIEPLVGAISQEEDERNKVWGADGIHSVEAKFFRFKAAAELIVSGLLPRPRTFRNHLGFQPTGFRYTLHGIVDDARLTTRSNRAEQSTRPIFDGFARRGGYAQRTDAGKACIQSRYGNGHGPDRRCIAQRH